MSYNLYAEGDFDLLTVLRLVESFVQVEVFPILDNPNLDAIGIALPSSRANPEALEELDALVQQLLAADARVFDLFTGERIATMEDLESVHSSIVSP